MPRRLTTAGVLLALGAVALVPQCAIGPRDFGPRTVRFNRDVRPLLSDRCFHCHGPDKQTRKANLRLDRSDGPHGAYRERRNGRAIEPGSLEESLVWQRLTTTDKKRSMPPSKSHKQPLSESEKAIIRAWILEGAQYEDHWAFVPPATGKVDDEDGAIDFFVRGRLADAGLRPSPRADKRALIRRVTFDLTGLPPTREEIRMFLADTAPDAYERLVDRLLARPQYGEHMARYWLDLVRFADTNGIHHDHYRDMTPFRDWVIRSFNSNLPYDEFITWQLAGDLYPRPTDDQLVASGFHRLHLIIDVGTALPEESFTRNVVDRVTAFGTAFLGLTLGCAVCHDHKYDPIGQKDFYQLYAFFNNLDAKPETGRRGTEDFKRGLQPPYVNFSNDAKDRELAELDCERLVTNERIAALEEEQREAKKAKKAAEKKAEKKAAEKTTANRPIDASAGKQDPKKKKDTEKKKAEKKQDKKEDPRLKKLATDIAAAKKRVREIQKKREAILRTIPAAMVMKERDEMRAAHILIRGNYDDPGDEVSRAVPAFLPPLPTKRDAPTRMDLAKWLLVPEHPLTARVAVNRIWQQFFGVGLVKTSEDFGMQGEWPSHPELLDWLAVWFRESGWDVKALVRKIVTSRVYQQSSEATPEAFTADPENRLLARGSRFRMDAEMIRDQILATSGLLNPEMFGFSVKPPQPDGVWKSVTLPSSFPRIYKADAGDKIYRRSVYSFWKRGLPPPQMTLLNAPTRESCVARRERTNTPLQALLLWNESEYFKAARNLARKTLAGDATTEERLHVLYETITSRGPDADEIAALVESLKDLEELYAGKPELAKKVCDGLGIEDDARAAELAAWTMVVSTLYNLDITKTRQ